VKSYDYFVCASSGAPAVEKVNFYYAAGRCPLVKSGTAFSYGAAEPKRGNVLYDRSHGIVFYDKGCCAWRGFALNSTLAAPPQAVNSADLAGVRTSRGVALGMNATQVERIYGAANPRPAAGENGVTTLSYTTMKGTPAKSSEACGQFQSFSFQHGRLVSIELLAGC